jgi:formylglycine-generating enzyme required for sulfatase activity
MKNSASPSCLALLAAILLSAGCDNAKKPVAATESASGVKTPSGIEMAYIPPGEFIMGVSEGPIDAKPAHPVKVDGFLMDRYEVNQEVYEKLTGQNPSRRKNPKNPVEQTSWSAAVKFCNKRSAQEGLTPCYDTQTWACNFDATGYRLPTEAEWEYACRAGTASAYYFGDQPEKLRSHAWFDANSEAKPRPVGHWEPNPWGLYDMLGNVSEWCNDFYSPKYYKKSPKENPRGPDEGEKRVLRGGAWSSNAENCSSWFRNCDEAGFTDVCLTMDSDGFRCVRKAAPGEAVAAKGPKN